MPRFEYGVTGPSVQSNLTTREDLPRTFKGRQVTFSGNIRSLHYRDLHYHKSALSELYPVGSEVDIWYDPADPRNAYVQRPIREGRVLRILMSVFGSVFLLAALLFLFLGVSGVL
ncbi:MAG: DUF3592 domain-containing protein [Propionibacteriaceae bacterium]|nr:DUF3592 domain-containing protein [Propionibacteriaceae bacterium]